MKRSNLSALFIGGIFTLGVGFLLLMLTLGGFPLFAKFWAVIPLVLGKSLLAYFIFKPKKPRPRYLLWGLLNLLTGAFTLAMNIFWSNPADSWLEKAWPAYMGIIGIAFVPYAFQYKRKLRVTLIIPSYVLLVLSFVFLLFSSGLVHQDLSGFVYSWWPLLFLIFGGTLMLAYWFQFYSVNSEDSEEVK